MSLVRQGEIFTKKKSTPRFAGKSLKRAFRRIREDMRYNRYTVIFVDKERNRRL